MTTICPRCGVTIQNEKNPTCYNCVRIERERKRYGSRGSSTPFRAPSVSKPALSKRKPAKRKRAAKSPDLRAKQKQAVDISRLGSLLQMKMPFNAAYQCQGFHKFLTELYGRETYLSDILLRKGLSQAQVRAIKQQRLQQFLDRLLHELTLWWSTLLTWSQAQVLWQYYHLEPPDKQASEDVLPADEAGCQQLLASALKRLRSASSKRQLERLIVKAARGT